MKYRFFKLVEGKKFYCDATGALVKDEAGATVAVPETDTEAVDIESGEAEVAKMVAQAMSKAAKAGETAATEAMANAQKAVTEFLEKVAEKATEK